MNINLKVTIILEGLYGLEYVVQLTVRYVLWERHVINAVFNLILTLHMSQYQKYNCEDRTPSDIYMESFRTVSCIFWCIN